MFPVFCDPVPHLSILTSWAFDTLTSPVSVLVVVGILIAVQINNWNQSRNRAQLETTLLKQLKVEMLNIYDDIYSDYNLISLGIQSHYDMLDYIDQDVAYNDSMSFDFAVLKIDEYIYPSDAVYSRIKEEGLDIIRNDSIRYLTQGIYESTFPRLSKINSFHPDISPFRTSRQFLPIYNDVGIGKRIRASMSWRIVQP